MDLLRRPLWTASLLITRVRRGRQKIGAFLTPEDAERWWPLFAERLDLADEYLDGGDGKGHPDEGAVDTRAMTPTILAWFPSVPEALVPRLTSLALGDSFSSGLGARDYDDDGCKRGPAAYPELWSASHTPASFAFVACSGATTADVLDDQVCALAPETNLVTITIGGNDVGFADAITTCRLGSNADCDAVGEQAENEVRDVLPGLLDQTYGAITDRATAAGLVRVDVNGYFDGHRVCADQEWINGTTVPLGESYHPNAPGRAEEYLPAMTSAIG